MCHGVSNLKLEQHLPPRSPVPIMLPIKAKLVQVHVLKGNQGKDRYQSQAQGAKSDAIVENPLQQIPKGQHQEGEIVDEGPDTKATTKVPGPPRSEDIGDGEEEEGEELEQEMGSLSVESGEISKQKGTSDT